MERGGTDTHKKQKALALEGFTVTSLLTARSLIAASRLPDFANYPFTPGGYTTPPE